MGVLRDRCPSTLVGFRRNARDDGFSRSSNRTRMSGHWPNLRATACTRLARISSKNGTYSRLSRICHVAGQIDCFQLENLIALCRTTLSCTDPGQLEETFGMVSSVLNRIWDTEFVITPRLLYYSFNGFPWEVLVAEIVQAIVRIIYILPRLAQTGENTFLVFLRNAQNLLEDRSPSLTLKVYMAVLGFLRGWTLYKGTRTKLQTNAIVNAVAPLMSSPHLTRLQLATEEVRALRSKLSDAWAHWTHSGLSLNQWLFFHEFALFIKFELQQMDVAVDEDSTDERRNQDSTQNRKLNNGLYNTSRSEWLSRLSSAQINLRLQISKRMKFSYEDESDAQSLMERTEAVITSMEISDLFDDADLGKEKVANLLSRLDDPNTASSELIATSIICALETFAKR